MFVLHFIENKSCHFMWTVFLAEDSHEMQYYFLRKINKKQINLKMSSAAIVICTLRVNIRNIFIFIGILFSGLFLEVLFWYQNSDQLNSSLNFPWDRLTYASNLTWHLWDLGTNEHHEYWHVPFCHNFCMPGTVLNGSVSEMKHFQSRNVSKGHRCHHLKNLNTNC